MLERGIIHAAIRTILQRVFLLGVAVSVFLIVPNLRKSKELQSGTQPEGVSVLDDREESDGVARRLPRTEKIRPSVTR